ncbi:MAG: S46 family peptidase [Bacteroidales bacterium]|nr:S46 family peptidase [Bacteroidales bacterium]MCI2121655.1 S46 family peptidase [Bacteroidales bacterium]MCI2144969.1 S46 family peptidase [Bacteroidales bacterium]
MKKHSFLLIVSLLAVFTTASADEGMWLLPLLKQMNIKTMQSMGCKVSANDIYSVNHSSLKDAVVIFGRGCTAEVISDNGLLVTNHHCGYASIQDLSSVDHDYLTDGYWAMNRSEELPAKGLSVTFLISFTDVTGRILAEQAKYSDESERTKAVGELKKELCKKAVGDNPYYTAEVDSFYADNAYYLIVYEVYKDIRFVGAPPSSIGKFGADTDNWMWPRHTCDFSMFRIYADKDNNPAEYSTDNVPYMPKKSLTISLKGVKKDDFTFIMGYPGSTDRYMSESELEERTMTNEIAIKCRGKRQEIMLDAMQTDPKVRIQYSSKYAGSSNGWKKYIGMNETFKKLNVMERRAEEEKDFTQWYSKNAKLTKEYSQALPEIDDAMADRKDVMYSYRYLYETLDRIELVSFSAFLDRTVKELSQASPDKVDQDLKKAVERVREFYKDYDPALDRKIAKAMIRLYGEDSLNKACLPPFYSEIDSIYGGNTDAFVDYVYDNSIAVSEDKAIETVNGYKCDSCMKNDPAFEMSGEIRNLTKTFAREAHRKDKELAEGKKLFTKGQLEMKKGRPTYPDANFTMRLTYGRVEPYSPRDGVTYDYYTTLDGVMQKEDPNNWEFVVPEKLKRIYKDKDYGRYGLHDGKMPDCFIMTGDITGGNSGSPVMNAKGELVGLAFDGNWESMSGDIIFEPQLQRCICVDIRYVLLILDKYGDAGYLLKEMKIDD